MNNLNWPIQIEVVVAHSLERLNEYRLLFYIFSNDKEYQLNYWPSNKFYSMKVLMFQVFYERWTLGCWTFERIYLLLFEFWSKTFWINFHFE